MPNSYTKALIIAKDCGASALGSIFGVLSAASTSGQAASVAAIFGAGAAGAAGVAIFGGIAMALEKIAERRLPISDNQKVLKALECATEKISARIRLGEVPRNDSFFDVDDFGRSSSDEIIDGVIFGVLSEHEEKKIEYIGNIYSAACFNELMTVDLLNHLVKIANDLTYSQMVLLAIFARNGQPDKHQLRMDDYSGLDRYSGNEIPNEETSIYTDHYLLQSYELAEHGFLRKPFIDHPGAYERLDQPAIIAPGILELTKFGQAAYLAMGLSNIPEEEQLAIVSFLK